MSATIKPFTDEFEEYGRDESRSSGEASSISFPTSEDEVRAILRQLHAERVSVTVQGARTGLAARRPCPMAATFSTLPVRIAT